jgi:large subunit ribosomal protein L15
MKLNTLKPSLGATKKVKRIGRGQGSGHGGTSTRGTKGAKSVSGYNNKPAFEGGQMPLQRRLPKFGFTNLNRVSYNAINLDTIEAIAAKHPGKTVDHALLVECGIISNARKLVKLLGRGEVKAKLDVKLNKFSASAKSAIEAAGGTTTEV